MKPELLRLRMVCTRPARIQGLCRLYLRQDEHSFVGEYYSRLCRISVAGLSTRGSKYANKESLHILAPNPSGGAFSSNPELSLFGTWTFRLRLSEGVWIRRLLVAASSVIPAAKVVRLRSGACRDTGLSQLAPQMSGHCNKHPR